MIRFFALVLLMVFMPAVSLAAEIGRIQLNDREVILFDDNTWKYAEPSAAAASGECKEVKSEKLPLSLCLDANVWTLTNLGGEAELQFKLKAQELYLLVITEKTFIEMPALKQAVITNAQNASGFTKVKVLADTPAIIDKHSFGKLTYTTTVDGVNITYDNYYSNVGNTGSFQFVFFAGREEFDSLKGRIAEVVRTIKVSR